MNTIIINYGKLNAGGIENFIYFRTKYALNLNTRVVWLASKPLTLFKGYGDIVDKMEIIYTNKIGSNSNVIKRLSFSQDEKVTIFSFTPFSQDFALKIKDAFPNNIITPLYIVANTKGKYYFIEDRFVWPLNVFVKKKYTKIVSEWEEAGCIRFFTDLQIKAHEDRYSLTIEKKESKKIPPINTLPPLDISIIRGKAERKKFNIVSVTRFCFPHKQYLLGLIDAYADLKKIYKQLSLYIVGYGPDEYKVKSRIDSLPQEIKKNIYLLGAKSFFEIDELMKDMHLNVSVAGSVSCGARNGVLSLPARNFCGDICEVYGYLPDSITKTTSTDMGDPVIPYIEEIINMPDKDYIEKCKESYDAYAKQSENAAPSYIFNQSLDSEAYLQNHHLFFDVFRNLFYFNLLFDKILCFFKKK